MRKDNFKKDLNIFVRIFSLLYSLDKLYFPLVVIQSLLDTAKYFVTIILSASILDELLVGKDTTKLIIYVSIIVGVNLMLKLICDFIQCTLAAKSKTMRNLMQCKISQKIVHLDYEYMDSPKLHNLRQRILGYENMMGTTEQITQNIKQFIASLVQIVTSISITAALFIPSGNVSYSGFAAVINSPYMVFVILAGITAVIFSQLRRTTKIGQYHAETNEVSMGINRIWLYMQENLLGNYHYGKDLRMYDTTDLLNQVVDGFIHNFKNLAATLFNKTFKASKGSILLEGINSGLIYVFIVLKAYIGAITIGSIMKYVATIHKLTEGMENLLVSIALIRVNCPFSDNILELMDLPAIKYHGTLPVEKRTDNEYEIEFRKVSYKYPGADDYALKDVSLKLHIGERLAVVGMNGAGKTTFIKLLSRLYDPTEGEILLNGIDIKKYDLDEYMSLYSVVFQDFKMFSFELSQNIAVSKNIDESKVMEAIRASGLEDRVEKLPMGIKTYVGKNFDENGVDFSGGELQKMAIARALYRNAPIVILDEPTASLDPISEFEIYSKFDTLVGNKTAIYVSHRLSSCRFCHNIIVFHEGKIIQHGSHEKLLKNISGKYHELWQAQAQYYR